MSTQTQVRTPRALKIYGGESICLVHAGASIDLFDRDLQELESIFKLKIAGLLHKIQFQKNETPPALYDLVQLASEVHNYNTRYVTNQNQYRPPSRSNYSLARFRVVASQIWRNYPLKLSVPFKKENQRLLLDSQF